MQNNNKKGSVANPFNFDQKKLINAIKMPMEYLLMQCELGNKIFDELNYVSINELNERLQALIEFHNQINDLLYVISGLLTSGFPNQSAILAATLYEFSHQGIYIFNNEGALKTWLELHKNFDEDFKHALSKGNKKKKISIKTFVEDNVEKSVNGDIELEYGVYIQLCRFKHPHPIFCRLMTNGDKIFSLGGNRSDDQAIQHSWFIAFNAARYASYITDKILTNYKQLFSQDLFIRQQKIFKKQSEINDYVSINHLDWKQPIEIVT